MRTLLSLTTTYLVKMDRENFHYLPCKIQCTCDKEEKKSCRHSASVDTFFEPVVRKIPVKKAPQVNGVGCLGEGYSATFRGRPLHGVLVNVDEGFTGQVLRKCDEVATDMKDVCNL